MPTYTFLDMQNRIIDELINESITVAQIKREIYSTIAEYDSVSFYFNQKISTFNTVAGQEFYSVTDNSDIPNISNFFAVNAALSGVKDALTTTPYQWINENQTGSITGFPRLYSYFGLKIRFYPIPDKAYPIEMSYLYKFPDFVSDDDTNPWINDGEELIRQGTKRRIAFNILYDTEKGTLCGKLEDDAYDQLIQETRQRYPSPRLRAPELTSNSSFNIIRGY